MGKKKNEISTGLVIGWLVLGAIAYAIFTIDTPKINDNNTTKAESQTIEKKEVKTVKKKVKPNTLNGGYPACLTKKDLGDFSLSAMKSDDKMMLYLVNNGKCMITKKGTHFDLIDSSIFSGSAKIRIWINDKPVELYTNIENINI